MLSVIKRFSINWICNINVPQKYRAKILRWAGVSIKDPDTLFIGYGATFDTVNPQDIQIDESVIITTHVTILSHFLNPNEDGLEFRNGKVHICRNVFIGAGAIICNSVTIGEGAIIGAGAVVTKDIPAWEVWGG